MPFLKRLGLAFLLVVNVAGCADLERLLSPSPPPEPPAVKGEPSPPPAPAAPLPPTPVAPPSPPPVLSPQIGRVDEDRLRREASSRIQKTEQLVAQIDQSRLAKEQQETFSTIQNFLTNAKEALAARDFPRASNLADKAQILAEELLGSVR
ncbi:MAG TPA: hypothetical protein VLG48_10035 [Candidatus Methylomirabilis sp.]|nr:hypothetical protein [Candidatus Methylomirabilis sp.]